MVVTTVVNGRVLADIARCVRTIFFFFSNTYDHVRGSRRWKSFFNTVERSSSVVKSVTKRRRTPPNTTPPVPKTLVVRVATRETAQHRRRRRVETRGGRVGKRNTRSNEYVYYYYTKTACRPSRPFFSACRFKYASVSCVP